MIGDWVPWKHFPDPGNGEHLEAPIGPGVYEVRDATTGGLIAFGHSPNVASDLTRLLPKPAVRWKRMLFGAEGGDHLARQAADFEYRTRAASTPDEARIAAERLNGQRNNFWRRRASWA